MSSSRGPDGAKRKVHELWSTLRQVQRKTGCTTSTLKETFKRIKKLVAMDHVKGGDRSAEREMRQESGACGIRLDGCAGCDEHVFLPSEKTIFCPKCRHPRFNAKHKPNEVGKK